jgi:hypothetical protein
MTPLKAARKAPSAKTAVKSLGVLIPSPRTISSSSTPARTMLPSVVRSSTSHSTSAITTPVAMTKSR